eukprot:RCo007066
MVKAGPGRRTFLCVSWLPVSQLIIVVKFVDRNISLPLPFFLFFNVLRCIFRCSFLSMSRADPVSLVSPSWPHPPSKFLFLWHSNLSRSFVSCLTLLMGFRVFPQLLEAGWFAHCFHPILGLCLLKTYLMDDDALLAVISSRLQAKKK